jgi:glycine cleavage system H protein
MYPKDYRYTKEHEWVSVAGDVATVGITSHAQDQLGDVVFVELPQTGAKLHAGQTFGTVESVKAVSDIYSPISGDVVEVNEALIDAPEKINEDPHGDGWLVKAKVADKAELDALMSAEDYQQYVAAETES